MAQRPKGCDSKLMTADGYVCSDPKNVYALVITATGATAGDKIALRDGGPTGTVRFRAELPATAGIWPIDLSRYGIFFKTNIYYTEQVTAGTKIKTNVIFD